MGAYVNPGGSNAAGLKEKWLVDRWAAGDAVPTSKPERTDERPGWIPLVFVLNGNFTALGIIYDDAELERSSRLGADDPRPALWVWTRFDDDLYAASDLEEYLPREAIDG